MPVYIAILLGFIAAVICTVLALVFITPKKKRATLNKFFQFIHDLFNFKFLILELILKVSYIFMTLFCIATGFFLLFSGYNDNILFGEGTFHSLAGQGLMIMVLGPIIIRVIYEASMLFILLVKNTISINKKITECQKTETDCEMPAMQSFDNEQGQDKNEASEIHEQS